MTHETARGGDLWQATRGCGKIYVASKTEYNETRRGVASSACCSLETLEVSMLVIYGQIIPCDLNTSTHLFVIPHNLVGVTS